MSSTKKANPSGHRVYIVEDHPVFREGMVRVLKSERDFEVCGEAGTYEAALKGIKELKPDIVLVDLELPDKSGLELIKKMRSLKLPAKSLVVSMYDEALYAERVLRAGGGGYIMKEESPQEIVEAIHDVLAGHIYVSDSVMASRGRDPEKPGGPRNGGPLDDLTDLELKILELLGQGKSNAEVAGQLRLSAKTIPRQCAELRRKLKLDTDNALIRYAVCWVETGVR